MQRRSRAGLGAVLALAALGAFAAGSPAHAAPAASPAHRPTGSAFARYVVRLLPAAPADDALAAAVSGDGGRVVAVQHAVGTAVVLATPAGVARLAALPGVRAVTPDAPLRATSLGFAPSGQAGAMTNVTRITGANELWKAGWTGKGVDVALVDSGVAPVPALANATKVVVGPDLSFESQSANLRYLDTYGHGTHMAGIIAGRETAAASGATYAADTANFYGMAPDSRIVSLKLADRNGIVDVSQVVAAIDWVVQHRSSDGLNVRVLNFSYGTLSNQGWDVDPLAWAAEVAWHRGIVVVTAAGNDGQGQYTLANPAYDPWLLAVGAADTRGTDSRADDFVPSFSARPGSASSRSVDLVAPGAGIVAPGVPGSYLYSTYTGAHVGNGFLRGSGTSQATAVVSGAVALLLQQRPALTPDGVKDLLRRSAVPLGGVPSTVEGTGELDVLGASRLSTSVTASSAAWGKGTGRLETTRNGRNLVMDGRSLSGEIDVMSSPWDDLGMAGRAGNASAWTGGTFNGVDWLGTGFGDDTTTVAGRTWSGKTWSGKTWSGKTWSGKTWSSVTFSGSSWAGSGWSAASWPSATGVPTWAGALWSSAGWS